MLLITFPEQPCWRPPPGGRGPNRQSKVLLPNERGFMPDHDRRKQGQRDEGLWQRAGHRGAGG